MAWNLTHWFISTQVPTAKTIIWRPPPQYSVDTSACVFFLLKRGDGVK